MTSRASNTPSTPKDRIIGATLVLFYRDGIQTTSMDMLIAQASVSKRTLYKTYGSKDEMVFAYLRAWHVAWLPWLQSTLSKAGGKPGGGLTPLANVMEQWFRDANFRGCAFLNATAEAAHIPGVLDETRAHKDAVAKLLEPLLKRPKTPASIRRAAQAIVVAMDGATMRAQSGALDEAVMGLRAALAAID